MAHDEGTRLTIMAPIIKGRKGEHKNVISRIKRDGFIRIRLDGEMVRVDEQEEFNLNKNLKLYERVKALPTFCFSLKMKMARRRTQRRPSALSLPAQSMVWESKRWSLECFHSTHHMDLVRRVRV